MYNFCVIVYRKKKFKLVNGVRIRLSPERTDLFGPQMYPIRLARWTLFETTQLYISIHRELYYIHIIVIIIYSLLSSLSTVSNRLSNDAYTNPENAFLEPSGPPRTRFSCRRTHCSHLICAVGMRWISVFLGTTTRQLCPYKNMSRSVHDL